MPGPVPQLDRDQIQHCFISLASISCKAVFAGIGRAAKPTPEPPEQTATKNCTTEIRCDAPSA